mgnify:CR=1 FL=1
MENIHYVGLDVHKKTIAYCIKTATGTQRAARRSGSAGFLFQLAVVD